MDRPLDGSPEWTYGRHASTDIGNYWQDTPDYRGRHRLSLPCKGQVKRMSTGYWVRMRRDWSSNSLIPELLFDQDRRELLTQAEQELRDMYRKG